MSSNSLSSKAINLLTNRMRQKVRIRPNTESSVSLPGPGGSQWSKNSMTGVRNAAKLSNRTPN